MLGKHSVLGTNGLQDSRVAVFSLYIVQIKFKVWPVTGCFMPANEREVLLVADQCWQSCHERRQHEAQCVHVFLPEACEQTGVIIGEEKVLQNPGPERTRSLKYVVCYAVFCMIAFPLAYVQILAECWASKCEINRALLKNLSYLQGMMLCFSRCTCRYFLSA